MRTFFPRITDDRGSATPAYPLRRRWLDGLSNTALPAALAATIRADINASRPAPARDRWVQYAIPLFILANMALLLTRLGVMARGGRLLIAATILAAAGLATQLLGRFASSKEIAWSFLAHRRCPSCAYDLSAISPESDGCRVCPECGAAWKLP
jgi:hypothetical protein